MENIAASELDKEPRTLPEYIGMYDLSGFGRIRVHDFERYERAKSQLSQIESANEKSLKKLSFDIRKADFYNKIDVIERGISDKDPKKIATSLRFVSTIPPKDALRIVQLGLDSGDSEIESGCANAINYVPYIERGRLIARLANKIESGLLRNNPDDFNNYCQMSRNVPEDQKNRIRILIKEKMLDGFDNPDPEQKIKYLEGLRFMSDEDSQLAGKRLKEVMSDIFSGDDEHSKIIMAKALRFLPADDRPSFVLEALRSQNNDLRREYSKHLLYIKGEGRIEAVRFCLQDNDPELQKKRYSSS